MARNITMEVADRPLVHELVNKPKNSMSTQKIAIAAVIILLAGIGSGYGLAKATKGSSTSTTQSASTTTTTDSKGKTSVGSGDTRTFSDSAEGDLEEGGLNGEGTHKLVRPGGDSQTVYLTSSVLDLNQFVGKKVKVWGQTLGAKKVGWLMDVGKVEAE